MAKLVDSGQRLWRSSGVGSLGKAVNHRLGIYWVGLLDANLANVQSAGWWGAYE